MVNKYPTEVYKIHPVPIPQLHKDHKISAYIEPRSTYITLDHGKRAYSFLSEDDLKNCMETPQFKICGVEQPIYETSGEVACEYLLLNQHNEENLKKCNKILS